MRQMNSTKEDAQDIFTEALINLRDKVLEGNLKEVKNLRAYLLGTCKNMLRKKWLHQQKHREKAPDIVRYFYTATHDKHFDGLEFAETKAAERSNKDRKIKLLQDTFMELKEQCRGILTMFYVYGNSMKEIAVAMQFANAKVAKTSKARCFKQWRQLIENQETTK